jgi:hypothetical protein
MRSRLLLLGVAATIALGASTVVAQQQPIFGCRTSVSCRPSPLSNSAVLDGGSGSLLFGVGIIGGPDFNFRVVTPPANVPTPEPTSTVDSHGFRLWSVTLRPTPTPAPKVPTPTPKVPTPAPPLSK